MSYGKATAYLPVCDLLKAYCHLTMVRSGEATRFGLATAIWALPQVAAAQSIAGLVRDASGAVLPGVTVEASSPALIERPHGGQRRHRPVPLGEPLARRLHRHVHADWLRDRAAHRRRGADRRDHHAQHRDARRRLAGDHHGDRRDAGRRRPEQHAQAERCSTTSSSRRCRRRAATGISWRPCPASRRRASRTAVPRRHELLHRRAAAAATKARSRSTA